MIEVENLSKIFWDRKRGEIKAVDDVGFRCGHGEIFGLLGPNGAGKTTVLRILSSVLCPTSGAARIEGFDVRRDPRSVRRRIGFISGNTGVYEKLTPAEMVAYFGRLHGMGARAIESRIREIFALFDMEEFAHTINGKLSSGMRQKVSIARAIVHDPPVLIFDEPTVTLDVLVARTVLDFIANCRQRNKCVILSTHIMSEAEKLCDRVAVIHRGRILAMGTPREIKERSGCADLEDAFFSLIRGAGGTA